MSLVVIHRKTVPDGPHVETGECRCRPEVEHHEGPAGDVWHVLPTLSTSYAAS